MTLAIQRCVSVEVDLEIPECVSGEILECVSNEEVCASEGLASSDVFVPSRKPVELPGKGIDREVDTRIEAAAADSGHLNAQLDAAGVKEDDEADSTEAAGRLKSSRVAKPDEGDIKVAEFVPRPIRHRKRPARLEDYDVKYMRIMRGMCAGDPSIETLSASSDMSS